MYGNTYANSMYVCVHIYIHTALKIYLIKEKPMEGRGFLVLYFFLMCVLIQSLREIKC